MRKSFAWDVASLLRQLRIGSVTLEHAMLLQLLIDIHNFSFCKIRT